MTIRQSLRQMATAKPLHTAPGHPERGNVIDIDGEACTVTSSAQVAGHLVIYARDNDTWTERTITLPVR
jgi:hypothetical protein